MKKVLLIPVILVLLCACNDDVNPPVRIPIEDIGLARDVARTIANLSVGTTVAFTFSQTLTDYIVNGQTGAVILNGEIHHEYYAPDDITNHSLTNVDMEFSGYKSSSWDLTVESGSLLVNASSSVGVGVSTSHDIEGTINISGSINEEAFNDTVILDFEMIDNNFTDGTLTNGDGIVFIL